MFAERLRRLDATQPIGVIGGGATGSLTGLVLAALGLGPVTILEAEERVLSGLATSLNSVGTNHHMAWGGHPRTMEHFFKCAVLFNELFPAHVFSTDAVNYYVPGCTPNGGVNTAIEERDQPQDGGVPAGAAPATQHEERISARANAARLEALYRQRVDELGKAAVFGPVEDFSKLLHEADLRRMIGGSPPPANKGRWLVERAGSDGFVEARQLRQCVLNNARFCVHVVRRLEEFVRRGKIKLLTQHVALDVRPAEQGFEVLAATPRGKRRLRFHDVVNTAYAGGAGLSPPGVLDDGLYAALKVFGLYRLPPSLADSFVSFILIRGQFGSAVRAGPELVSVCSGKEFDRDTVTLEPGPVHGRRLPEHWTGLQDSERRADALGARDAELLDRIQKDMARWVPMIGGLRPVALKAAPQLYPRERATADDVSAANREAPELDHLFLNPAGGRYFRLLGAKMVAIPFAAAKAAESLTGPHVEAGRLGREEVAEHLSFDAGYVELSESLKIALGRDAPEADRETALAVMRQRHNLPPEHLGVGERRQWKSA